MKATVSKSVEFDAGHRVPMHASKCRNPHGHRYKVVAFVDGPILGARGMPDDGMVVDFGDIKRALKVAVHDVLDHGFMVWREDDRMLAAFTAAEYDTSGEEWKIVVMPSVPTAENLAVWCYERVSRMLPAALTLLAVEVHETPTSIARFQP